MLLGIFNLHLNLNMGRKHRLLSSEYPIHIGARCINRDWFRLDQNEVWSIFCDYLYIARVGFEMKIHSFVLMSNHFHLLASFPQGNMSEAMSYFLREVSREISRKSLRINQTFGGPFHSSIITSYHYYLHAYKYIYRNPVEAKIVQRVEEYPYSTLHGLAGASPLYIQVEEDSLLMDDFEGTLSWLNQNYQGDHREQIRKALRRESFALPRNKKNGRESLLEYFKS